jgi:hypothetical protein
LSKWNRLADPTCFQVSKQMNGLVYSLFHLDTTASIGIRFRSNRHTRRRQHWHENTTIFRASLLFLKDTDYTDSLDNTHTPKWVGTHVGPGFPLKLTHTHYTLVCVYGRRRTFGVKKKGGKNLVNWPTEFFSPNVGLHKQSFRDFIFISAAEMGSSVCVC